MCASAATRMDGSYRRTLPAGSSVEYGTVVTLTTDTAAQEAAEPQPEADPAAEPTPQEE